ncbi:DUF4157 domain-containing protein [Kordia sp.]|uniref:eCIS core domain-containing protein n=1 Tax=Kordia sp. TaxID=1965332 RepID=UPI0025C20001|nr:DUF4157 domain-containing protein [Kordia sp.]MCH2196891.1 DUF4157 domain-containing protein [Kordia sp.]
MEQSHTKKTKNTTQQTSVAHIKTNGKALEDNRSTTIIQQKNSTGLPDNLKSGIEKLSGHSLDDVKVHYNSSKPAQLNAHAYAQGTNIHVAAGQEKHLPHEAWHVVQQKQGRVQATKTVNGAKINDNVALEKEADVMSTKALQRKAISVRPSKRSYRANAIQLQAVIQFLKSHASKFILAHDLRIGNTKEEVEAYVKNKKNPFHLRKGLVEAWNKPGARSKRKRSNAHSIDVPADLRPTSTDYSQTDDLGGWNSEDEDMLDLSKTIGKRKKSSIDLQRGDKKKNKSGVPVVDIFDGIRFGRQVNKRDDYSHLPFSVDLGGHQIEFDNPGTKDIYATPLNPVTSKSPKKRKIVNKKYKRAGTSQEYNWKKLSSRLDAQKYKNIRLRQLQMLRFFLRKGKKMQMDRFIAEALAAIASDLMKGSKGGRYFLYQALKKVEANKKAMSFAKLFAGTKPLYSPAAPKGRGLVTDMTSRIEIDANRLLTMNNCLINAISRAARRRKPNLGELMRIREQVGAFGTMLVASPEIIGIIRNVLHIQNPITIIYPGMIPPENFGGTGTRLSIYHVNGNHFQTTPPMARRSRKGKGKPKR